MISLLINQQDIYQQCSTDCWSRFTVFNSSFSKTHRLSGELKHQRDLWETGTDMFHPFLMFHNQTIMNEEHD